MEDQKLLTLLWQRSETAIEGLSRRFGQRLMSMAMQLLGRPQDAEESVNDTYLAVWNAVPPARPDPLAGFVYATGRNICLDRLKYRTAQKRAGYTLSLEELAEAIPGPALEERVSERELGRAINAFLGSVSPEDRTLFLRRYWFGDEVRQIAKDRGMRPNTVSVRLNRLRESLRQWLIREGYGNE